MGVCPSSQVIVERRELDSASQNRATQVPKTFHRRVLPAPAIEFSSLEGQRIFREALEAGTMGGFFRLIEQFHTQVEPAFCGLGTLTMVLNAMNVDPCQTWKGPWRWYHEGILDCCEPLDKVKEKGITWPKWLCLARCNGVYVEAYRASDPGGDIEAFRRLVCSAHCQECGSTSEGGDLKALVVGYSRKQFGQTGDGHYSPIGGYHAESDRILVLDVARFKHPPHWVPLTEMHASMLRVDGDTGCSRGFALLTKKPDHGGWLSLQMRETVVGKSCCEKVQSDWTWDFLESMLFKPIEVILKSNAGISAAREVMETVIKLFEHSQMPLTVACRKLGNDDLAADAQLSSTGEVLHSEPTTGAAYLTQVENERLDRKRTLDALGEVAKRCCALLGDCHGNCAFQESTDKSGDIEASRRELFGVELRTALILSLDMSLWTRAICPEVMPKATPDDTKLLEPESNVVSVGAEVWGLLQPLLDLECLPSILKAQVATLRAQCLDLLTASSSSCSSNCSK